MSAPPNVPPTGASSTLIGVIATKADLAPSIIFILAFFFLVPLAIWRSISQVSRSWLLVRPGIFIVVRIATYIVRAIEANGNYSVGVIATELVLLTIGTVLLVEPLIELTKRLLEACVPYDGPISQDRRGRARRRDPVGVLSRVLKLALIAVVALSIYTATKISDTFSDPDAAHTVSMLRKIVAAIIVAILALCILGLAYFHVTHSLPTRPMLFLIMIALLLEVTAAYRLASAAGDAGARNHVAFWLASALPEWLVATAYFSINLNTLMPPKRQAEGQPVPMGQHAQPAYQYAHIPPVQNLAEVPPEGLLAASDTDVQKCAIRVDARHDVLS